MFHRVRLYTPLAVSLSALLVLLSVQSGRGQTLKEGMEALKKKYSEHRVAISQMIKSGEYNPSDGSWRPIGMRVRSTSYSVRA